MAQRRENRDNFQKRANVFRENAALIIIKMLKLSEETGNTVLVEEILHSILFLGKIYNPPVTPEMILRERLNDVRQLCPELFQEPATLQLPRRSPFSCVLDMMVCRFGENNEEEIKTRLQEFILYVCLYPSNETTPIQEISQDVFIRNARIITEAVLALSNQPRSLLLNQILHSVFFLGHQKNPRCTPEMILGERNEVVRQRYPEPFQHYESKEPIPCVLNKIHYLIGQENTEKITSELQKLLDEKTIYGKFFLPCTVCVSQGKNSVRYYGVSIPTFPGKQGPKAREIMIAASCLGSWHEHVAGAVMTYLPNIKSEIKTYKDENIDGTIKLLGGVRCEAFSLKDGRQMPPCKSCAALFSLQTTVEERSYVYGNCAEVESLSKVLTNETQVRAELRAPESWIGNEAARNKIQQYLTRMLLEKNFNWEGQFYRQ